MTLPGLLDRGQQSLPIEGRQKARPDTALAVVLR